MIDHERACRQSEQRLVLWTWLREGHLPVAHLVADLDELGDDHPTVPRRDPIDTLDILDTTDTMDTPALGCI